MGPREQKGNFFFGPDCPESFAAASLRAFGFCRALVSTLPFLGGDFTQSDLTPVRIYAAIDGWKSNGNSLQYSCLENPMDEGAW